MSQEQRKDISQYFYRASAADFMKIPGSPVAYWVSESVRLSFANNNPLSSYAFSDGKNITGNNDKYQRFFWEVSCPDVGAASRWRFISKGGGLKRWTETKDVTIDWGDAARDHYRKSHIGRIIPEYIWFKKGITWGLITSSLPSFRVLTNDFTFSDVGIFFKDEKNIPAILAFLNSKPANYFLSLLNPTLNYPVEIILRLPISKVAVENLGCEILKNVEEIGLNGNITPETSWDFTTLPLIKAECQQLTLQIIYQKLRNYWREMTLEMQRLEEENNRIFIDAYGLQDELTPEVPLDEITLTCNPHYRYGANRSEEELETQLQCDTLREQVSYAIGCMMGRYSLDKPGLILASQGETLQDYLRQIPAPCFAPDDDAILPLTDQEWFSDDATHRFREFIRVVWGDENLQQNLDFVAESLCLHAIKPKKGENSLDTIRRYLSTQFFKDHLRTYKKRPIYWLFSSGKHKAFECLVYLHRYNEGTLARMRTEYVIPLTAKLSTYAAKLEKDVEASTSTAEKKRLEKELTALHNQQAELATFDEKLRHYADQRINLDLDEGVKVNYGRFGDLLAEVKAVTGDKAE
ncbi:BREX-1 system adenine-specific DNA-methyltransferase PglX [Pseudomonas aeruginosa]|uniref:BREX-1 system adenine-specific DNA-methyltransferase PglX n=1 Tax=Pseudomonas aeruginosa TaxID=287 RepID=UPI000F831704|nr:BREX-1 system adenine-specific DNA-methyltransferase PglX [Pseudomonas aeruginosa]MDI3611456.1 BREX-1 system adenine-specific DNA-methyltransferase PglX [Pseudomonas aeruginosa]MDI4011875.1 BREX-1 system adenine-specific DNA-methyltransferase PglX [Pseudomonas aeruginosa]MDI4024807.1 BREX-1 system adenine-specific DNA-methyltransferase PglX [Pseudomonas aeruginosa]RTU19434.1 BREX-1 system adenine-specific DNA-methyltransferase PglX [Pseudomonas aeruginosa]HCF2053699.1 BREX-1 system adenine-